MDEIIFKCFETKHNYYVYDRNTGCILLVPKKDYACLKEFNPTTYKYNIAFLDVLSKYQRAGFLLPSRLKKLKHPETYNIEHYLRYRLKQLVLQVTQQCNLRCEYCAYSGNYANNRVHSNKRMDFDMAKRAIDMFISRSSENPEINVSFYGGEPLLEFDLLKKCVFYSHNNCEKKIVHNITTNGTLLTDEIVDFLVEYDFDLLISLDGSRKEHNKNRKFANGKGSFDVIINNVMRLWERYPDYYANKVRFNTVINAKTDICCSEKFFKASSFIDNKQTLFSMISPDNEDRSFFDFSNSFYQKINYEKIKLFLSMINKIPDSCVSPLVTNTKDSVSALYKSVHGQNLLPESFHHGGPCLPGIRKCFVAVDGTMYPCEKVGESSEFAKIGSLNQGFDLDNIYFLLNNGTITHDECMKCWNLRECNICIGQVFTKEQIPCKKDKLVNCKISKEETMDKFIELCTLRECGYKLPQDGLE